MACLRRALAPLLGVSHSFILIEIYLGFFSLVLYSLALFETLPGQKPVRRNRPRLDGFASAS